MVYCRFTRIKRTPKTGQSKGGKIGIRNVWKSPLRPQLRQAGPAILEPASRYPGQACFHAGLPPYFLQIHSPIKAKKIDGFFQISKNCLSVCPSVRPSVGRLVGLSVCVCVKTVTSSPAQGGGGSFKNKKPIGEVGCCESGMAKRIH